MYPMAEKYVSSERGESEPLLHIAHIARTNADGAGGSMFRLAKEMAALGHNVDFLTTADKDSEHGDVRVIKTDAELKLPHRLSAYVDYRSFVSRLRANGGIAHFLQWQKEQVQSGDYNIVNSGTPITLNANVLTPRSSIILEYLSQRDLLKGDARTQFEINTILKNPLFWTLSMIERYNMQIGHNYQRIIALSEIQSRQLQQTFGVPSSDISVVYNGTDMDRFHPRNREKQGRMFRNEIGVAQDESVFSFVGDNFGRKGLDTIIRAFGQDGIPNLNWRLVVAGKDNNTPYQKLAEEHGIGGKVKFLGRKDADIVFAGSDAFVFPTRVDPFGKVVAEAMATGVPPIVSDQAGAAELISHGESGYVLPANDPAQYAAAIKLFIQQPELRNQMGDKARQAIKPFTWQRAASETIEVYREVVHASK